MLPARIHARMHRSAPILSHRYGPLEKDNHIDAACEVFSRPEAHAAAMRAHLPHIAFLEACYVSAADRRGVNPELFMEERDHDGSRDSRRPEDDFSARSPLPMAGDRRERQAGVLLTDDDELFYRGLALGHYNKRCLKEIPEDHLLHRYGVTGLGLKLRKLTRQFNFAIRPANALVRLSEHAGFRWSILTDLSGLPVTDDTRRVVEAFWSIMADAAEGSSGLAN